MTFQSLVPNNWMWFFGQLKKMLYCFSVDHLPNNRNVNVKTALFQNSEEVIYQVNGKLKMLTKC